MVAWQSKLGFLVLLFSVPVFGAPQATESATALRQNYDAAKKDLVESEMSERVLLAELFKIKRKMKEIEKERGVLNLKKTSATANITSLNSILRSLRNKVNRQKSMVRQRIRALYKFGGRGVMRLAFASENPAALDQNLKILRN